MPDLDGIALMERVHAIRPSLPVVLVTAHATVETAVEAMRKGALHYLTKPIRYDELALVLRHAVAHERAAPRRRAAARRARAARPGSRRWSGTSPAMREVFSMVEQVAASDATVLLRGETGTGKELVARAIHRRSPRARAAVRGGELHGDPARPHGERVLRPREGRVHRRDRAPRRPLRAGATARRSSSTRWAISTSPSRRSSCASSRSRSSRASAARTPIRVDVRIVAATNRDLEALVREGASATTSTTGSNVIPLRLPPLRERPGDLPALLEHFLGSFAQRYGRPAPIAPAGRPRRGARATRGPATSASSGTCASARCSWGWAAVAPILGAGPRAASRAARPRSSTPRCPLLEARQRLVERFEREYLTRLLKEHRGRIGEVARAAGIAERNLYEKMKAYGLSRDDYR